MDNRLTPHTNDETIEDALRTYPVASLPKDFTSAVMSQIQQTSAPRFRVTLIDAAVALVLTISLLAAWFGLQALPPIISLQLRMQGMLLWQHILVNARWLVPASSIILGLALAFLALLNLRSPRRA